MNSNAKCKRVYSWFLFAMLLMVTVFSAFPSFSSQLHKDVDNFSKLGKSLRQQISTSDQGDVFPVIIRLHDVEFSNVDSGLVVQALKTGARKPQQLVARFLAGMGVERLNSFWLINAVLANVTVDVLYRLVELDVVEEVFLNFEVTIQLPEEGSEHGSASSTSCTWGLDRIDVAEAWGLGVNGSSVRICVLDTGVEVSHPDLDGKMWTDNGSDPTFPGGWIEFDWAGNIVAGSAPHDTEGHGTHTSGTVLGGNASGVAIGVAPGATLMHGLILPSGSGSFAQCVAGMQWATDPFDQYGGPAGQKADVVSMSWGADGHYDEMIEPVNAMIAAGVLPIGAIGNYGVGSSDSPGNVYECFGIGATNSLDTVALFSGGEVVDWPISHTEQYVKPDFTAPGVSVLSSVPPSEWEFWSGTSMATPHVAGTAALMLQANPALTVRDVYEILRAVADDLGDLGKDTRYGWGIINAYGAVALSLSNCGVEGYVEDSATSQPIEWGSKITVPTVPWGTMNTSVDGFYRMWLFPGNYSILADAFGYFEESAAVEVVEGLWSLVNFSLTPKPRGVVSGVVTDAAYAAISNASVTLTGTPLAPAFTDSSGRYALQAPTGAYTLEAWAWGYQQSTILDVWIEENQTVNVDFTLASAIKVAVLGDFRNQVTSLLMKEISAHERTWDVVEDIYNYDVVIVNIPSHPNVWEFTSLIAAADQYSVGLIFTNSYLGPWSPYGITLLQQYTGNPEGSYFAYWSGPVYYEVTSSHPIFDGWNIGDRIQLINGGDDDFAWFYSYSGVPIADIGSESLGLLGQGVAYSVRNGGNVHLLLAGLAQSSYTNVENAWTDDAKRILRNSVVWASEPALPQPQIVVTPNSGVASSKVEVNGIRFPPNTPVTIKFDDTPIANTRTNFNGSFTAVFNIPLAEAGVHSIKAIDEHYNHAESSFTVQYSILEVFNVTRIEDGIATLQSDLGQLKIDLSTTNAKIDSVQDDIVIIKTDVGIVKTSLAYLQPMLQNINVTLASVEGSIATLITDIGEIRGTITSIEGNIVIIETDLGEIRTSLTETLNNTLSQSDQDLIIFGTSVAIAIMMIIAVLLTSVKKYGFKE